VAVAEGIPVGFTDEGFPYRGDPDAPITVEEFSDLLCPYCGRHATQVQPDLLEQYVASGKVRFVFREFPIPSLHPTAQLGHVATLCVGEQDAEAYWDMHDRLFAAQEAWSGLPDPSAYLAGVAEAVGADMAAYEECVASGRMDPVVEAGMAAAQANGFNGTPSFRMVAAGSDEAYQLIGAQPLDRFAEMFDAMLAGEEPPQEPTQAPPELPYWAKPEGLAPDPDRPNATMAGDYFLGDPEAPLTVVEYTDYQCPSCRRHALETMPAVVEQMIDTGRIFWVVKHLPLPEYPQGTAAAAAAECAADQGAFWEMHDALFETVERWSVEPPDPELVAVAGELGLDTDAFEDCLGGRAALERVMADVSDARDVTQNTPTFVALYGGSGTVIRGAQPADEFISTLNTLIEDMPGEDSD
jgi:protein-disulfide isomerase